MTEPNMPADSAIKHDGASVAGAPVKYDPPNGGHGYDAVPQSAPLDQGYNATVHDARSYERDDVCRDYLKNICNRGNNCKFYHPPDVERATAGQIHFCIDFQVCFCAPHCQPYKLSKCEMSPPKNRGCSRANCRFVHVPKEEAERYKATREVTLPLARAIAAVTTGDTINGIPVCKEFQTGKCGRGAARCRYWHVNLEEERERRRRGYPAGAGASVGPAAVRGGAPTGPNGFAPSFAGAGVRRPAPMDDYYDMKRPRMEDQRVTELERRCAEQAKEIEGLKRELQREHERYEDLYALFRQQTGAPVAQVPVAQPYVPAPAQQSWGTGWN